MNITISTGQRDNKHNKKKNHLQREFDRLWQQVQKRQAANERLRQDLKDLETLYQTHILPIEKKKEEPFARLTARLIEFFKRKALAQYQRGLLRDWIMESIEHVGSLNAKRADELTDKYNEALADYAGMDVEELIEQAREYSEYADALGDEEIFPGWDSHRPGEDDPESAKEDMFGFDEDLFTDPFASHSQQGFEQPDPSAQERDLFGEQWLRTIFRRTANALHPDKEMDDERRLQKQALMSRLLTARDSKDVFELLSLYQEHVSDQSLDIDKPLMSQLCDHLEYKVDILEEEAEDLIASRPQTETLYHRIHSKSKKTRERNIQKHIEETEQFIAQTNTLVASLRNLDVLKKELAQREQEEFVEFHEFSNLLEEAFGFR